MVNDVTVAAVARASAASLLSSYHSIPAGRALDKALRDSSALVRSESARALGNYLIQTDPYTGEPRLVEERLNLLLDSLNDPSVAVRQAAAMSCLSLPSSTIPPKFQKTLEQSISEYKEEQESMLDRPSSSLNLGNLALTEGRTSESEKYFQMTLAMDPKNQIALMRLAVVYDSTDRFDDAVASLTKVIHLSQQTAHDAAGDSEFVRMQREFEVEARFQRALVLARRPDRLLDALEDLRNVIEAEPTEIAPGTTEDWPNNN